MSKEYTLTFEVRLPDTVEIVGLRQLILEQEDVVDTLCHKINSSLFDHGCAIKGQRVTLEGLGDDVLE